MNTVRLPSVESELVNEVLVDIVKSAPAIPVQVAANNKQFAASPFAKRPWEASSRRERQAAALAALVACVASLGTVVGLFASLT